MTVTDNGPGNTPSPERIAHEAIAWFTRLNGRPSARDRRDFDHWLAADPTHGAAWDEISRTWALAGLAATDEDAAEIDAALLRVQAIRHERAVESGGPSLRKAAMLAAVLVLPMLSGWLWLDHPGFLQDLRADHVTARGEQREITLADGTRVLLDADTAIATEFTPEERRVVLLRGAAYFDVTHSGLPFTVAAAGGEAHVLGTAFGVQMQEDSVGVTLERGSLEVTLDDGSAQPVLLSPGQATSYDGHGLTPAHTVDTAEALAWRDRRLVFNDARLGDVLERVERNRPGRIVVLGSRLDDYRVSGSFSLSDPERALAALQATVGFDMRRIGNRLVVIGP